MPRDEDDRDLGALLVQALLQLEAAQARHADVGDEAGMPLAVVALEKIERRWIRLVLKADGPEQHAERIAYGFVVVDEVDQRLVVLHAETDCCTCCAGSSIVKIDPPAGLSAYVRVPP